MTFSRTSFTFESRGAILSSHFCGTYFTVVVPQRATSLKHSSGEWDKKRNKREANHHCGDLLAAIRNHSSFGQVCAVNDSDT